MQTPKKRSVETKNVSQSGPNYKLAGKMKTISKDGEVVKTKIKRTITPTSTGKPMTTVSVIKGNGPDAPIKSRRGIVPVKAKTGGIVNPNAKVSASKVSKGRPAKSAEPMSAAKKATGRVGGISKAPKVANPKK